MNDRTPPFSKDSEQAVLGGLMICPASFDDVLCEVCEDAFYRLDHRLIWRSIHHLLGRGEPADTVTLAEYMDREGIIDDAGGREYLSILARDIPSAANIVSYAKIVRQKWLLRQGIKACNTYTGEAYNNAEPDLIIGALQTQLSNLVMGAQTGGPAPMSDSLGGWLTKLEARFESGDEIAGHPTGIADLDTLMGGAEAGDLVVVAGRPSMGKTALALQITDHMAEAVGGWGLVFSMEMPTEQLVTRCASSLGNIDAELFKHPKNLTRDDWNKLLVATKKIKDRRLLVDDSPALRIADLRARAKSMARKYTINVIMVDYIQLMQADTKENRTQQIAEISAGLKQLAKEMAVPVIALSQLNRSLEQRPDKRPRMSDLRESGAIEQDADVIAFVYRDEVYNPTSTWKGVAEIIIGKQRNGPLGTVYCQWEGRYTRFQNLQRGWQRPQEQESSAPKPFYERQRA